jgi:hypothetical protein
MKYRPDMEKALITTFIEKNRQARLLGFISNLRKREKVRRELATTPHFDQRFVVEIPPRRQTQDAIIGEQ